MARAYVGVGSNIDPAENVVGALELLALDPRVTLTGISTFYRTPALAGPDAPEDSASGDPDYLNGVIELRTSLPPDRLGALLEDVERSRGRTRTHDRYAPRTMDLDLLLYLLPGSSSEGGPEPEFRTASRPHPEIRTRSFVAVPLRELAPELRLPPEGTSIQDIADAFEGPGGFPETAFTDQLRRRFLGT
jgi:2-amino-4-hydroxy-6-hydroxymethyldihydropteridine diphosphokinase